MEIESFPRRQLQQGTGFGRGRRMAHGRDELRVKHINSYRREDGTLYPRIYHGYVQFSSHCQVQRSPMFTVVRNSKKPHLDAHVITAVAIRREREDAPGTYVSAISSVFSPFSAFNQARVIEGTNYVQVQIKAIHDTILAAYNSSNFMKFHGCRAIVIQIDKEMEWIARALCRFHDITEKASYDEIKLLQFLRYPELLTQLNGLIEGFEATTLLRIQFWPTDKQELSFSYQLVEKALDLHFMPAVPYDETLFDASDYDGSDYSIEDEELIECANAYEDDSHLIGAELEDGDASGDIQLVMNLSRQGILIPGQDRGQGLDTNIDGNVRKTSHLDGTTVIEETPSFALSSSENEIKNVEQTNMERQIQSAGTTTIKTDITCNANNTINATAIITEAPKPIESSIVAEHITLPNHSITLATPPPTTSLMSDSVVSSATPAPTLNWLSSPVTSPKSKPTLSPMSISVSDVIPRNWRLPSPPEFDSLPFSYFPPKEVKLDDNSLTESKGLLPSPLPRPAAPAVPGQTQPANTLLGGIVGLVSAMKNGRGLRSGGGGLLGELGKGGRIGLH